MLIDRTRALAHPVAPLFFDMERGRLTFFAQTIGLTDPIYSDVEAAKRAGYPDLLVPPTFLSNSLELEIPNPLGWLAELGGDLTKTTHAEQAFRYLTPAFGGDRLLFRRKVLDVYTRKGGQLEFVVKRTDVLRGEEHIAAVDFTIVLKHPGDTG